MPTNTAVNENGSSYQIRDNPLYGAAGHNSTTVIRYIRKMAEQSSSYSAITENIENTENTRSESAQ